MADEAGEPVPETTAAFTPEQIEAIAAAMAGTTSQDVEYKLGGYNPEYTAQEYSGSEVDASWQDLVTSTILGELVDTAKSLGEDPAIFAQIYTSKGQSFMGDMDRWLSQTATRGSRPGLHGRQGDVTGGMGAEFFTQTQEGINMLLDKARDWWKVELSDKRFSKSWGSTSGGGGGGGGGGRTLPTEAEIRQQFDLDQLAEGVQNIWRGTLLDQHKDARGLARQYVDAVVASQGQQKLDFETFVLGRARKEARHASIYKNKPAAMSEAQFLQPYHQAAVGAVGGLGTEAADIAIGGAQFGATAGQFQERLKRTGAVTSSAPFMNAMEGRLTSLKGLFKG